MKKRIISVVDFFLPHLNFRVIAGVILMLLGVILTAFLIGIPIFLLGFFVFWSGIIADFQSKGKIIMGVLNLTGFNNLPLQVKQKILRLLFLAFLILISLIGIIFWIVQ